MTTNTTKKASVPKGLAARGGAFWSSITTMFDLSAAELEILLEVCRTMGRLDELDAFITEAA